MPQPTRGDVHVVRALTNVSVAYLQSAKDFIAGQVFPSVSVVNQSDKYFKFRSKDFRRNTAKSRAPGTESAGGGFGLDTDLYSCEVYAIHKDVADQIRSNTDPAVDLDRAAAEFVTQQLLIQKEANFMASYMVEGVWATDVVGGTDFTQWNDSNSDPEEDIDVGKANIKRSTGLDANTLVVSFDTHLALKRNPLITDRYKYTSSDSITKEMIARFFEVDRYLVAGASFTSSNEGAGADVDEFLAGANAWLGYVPSAPGLLVPSAGYTFTWGSFSGANGGARVKRFRMEHLESDRVEGEFAYDHKVVLPEAGYFFKDVLSES